MFVVNFVLMLGFVKLVFIGCLFKVQMYVLPIIFPTEYSWLSYPQVQHWWI